MKKSVQVKLERAFNLYDITETSVYSQVYILFAGGAVYMNAGAYCGDDEGCFVPVAA